ncbi:MAG: LLM class flavin-dependent oxidoreductase, partial [Rhodobacteraceae bacterium]|nr:LLM class flavin-dependent oxidoreductase [Paracoccaceae bacterium]
LDRSKTEIMDLKAQAKAKGRDVKVLTFSHVICRPTEAEAQAFLQYTAVDNADHEAVDNLVRLQFAHAHSFPHDLLAQIKHLFAMGHGGFPLVGTPDQVAEGILKLHATGFSGTTLSFVDYVEEFPYFRDNVLPKLEAAGIR